MMHGPEKSDLVIVAVKPANKVAFPLRSSPRRNQPPRSRWSKGRGPRGMRLGKARTGLSAGRACHRRWTACGKPLPFGPEVGAVCGKAACTDLCGGRSAMSVPTATVRMLHLLTTALGTKPTCHDVRLESAIGGKPDIRQTSPNDRL
jgi:hypothetical protein